MLNADINVSLDFTVLWLLSLLIFVEYIQWRRISGVGSPQKLLRDATGPSRIAKSGLFIGLHM